jgi:phosphatidylinositol alpha-1,6-mannosyltransferase
VLTIASQTFVGSSGGISRVCELMVRAAVDAGMPLKLLSVQSEDEKYQALEYWHGYGGSRARFVAACTFAALSGERIFYDQLGTARAHLWPSSLSRPHGVWIHGIEVWEQMRPDRLRTAKAAGFMLANTKYTRERAIRQNKVFESTRVCWLATLEDAPPAQQTQLDGPPAALILGRLDDAAYKGHRELIEAWPAVVEAVPNSRLIVAGVGPLLQQYRSMAAASKAAAYIDIMGFVSERALEELWRRTIVFAMPSRGEGFGLAYIEAMRWGIPVIASVHDAGPEVNIHNDTGMNVDLGRPDELRDCLIELLRDRDLARRMGLAGQHRWRSNFCYSAFRTRFTHELTQFMSL